MTFAKSWCTVLGRSQWGAMSTQANSSNKYVARRIYELDSCILVSRLTVSCSVMNLPKAQALCTPHHENCGRLRLFAPP